MKVLIVLIIVTGAIAEQPQILKQFVAGNNAFAADVYKELVRSQHGSFSICPVSVEMLLAILHTGAQGTTAQQLSTGLYLPNNRATIQTIFAQLLPYFQGNEDYTLTCANKIYLRNRFQISNQYKTIVTEVFDATIENINFMKTTNAARKINRWVAETTHNKITNVINSDDLQSNLAAVLINAMYFHGKWLTKFRESDTKSRPFYVNNKSTVDTDMMEMDNYFNYYDSSELGAKFLEMPYKGNNVTMTFVLPNDKEGLPLLEANLANVLVAPTYSNQYVEVVLPKFKIETTISFASILQELGVVEPFADTADFSLIGANQEALKISKIVQKTYIEVNEVGTKTAVSTTGSVILLSANYKPFRKFIADHPFIYYIKVNDIIFFVGRYSGP